jgi:hypothetical protein
VPEGNWPGRCYRVIDLGTQRTTYNGETREKHQVMLGWELYDEECVMKTGPKAGMPMSAHSTYTWSMHEKSGLRKMLESWRGSKFVESDFGDDGFDMKKLLAVPCMIQIIHNDKGYANVGSVTKPPKGLAIGQLQNPTVFISLEAGEFDAQAFDTLSDKTKEKIKNSPEYQRLAYAGSGGASRMKEMADEDIPF